MTSDQHTPSSTFVLFTVFWIVFVWLFRKIPLYLNLYLVPCRLLLCPRQWTAPEGTGLHRTFTTSWNPSAFSGMNQCQCLCLYLAPAYSSKTKHCCPTLLKPSLFDTFSPTKRKKNQKNILGTWGFSSVYQIQNIHPGSHLKHWKWVKHNLWRSEKIIFYVLSVLTRSQQYCSLLSPNTVFAPLLNKSPNKSVTRYFG